MVRLYLLGFTHDLKGVVFSQRRNGKTATFWVPIDDTFVAAAAKLERARKDRDRSGAKGSKGAAMVDLDDLPAGARKRALPPVGRSQARSGMPAAEIQQMLREGKTVQTVAKAAKTPLAWVERLAEPVLTERIGVVRLAQRAYMTRARLGRSSMQLGDAVARNLEDRRAAVDNIDLDAAWDARQMASGNWRVWVRFSHRGKRRVAEWDFTKGSRTITPRNRLGAQIGWWAPEPEAEPEPVVAEDGDEGTPSTQQDAKPAAPRRRPAAKRKASRTTRSRPAVRSKKHAPARKKKSVPARRKKPVARKRAPAKRPARRRR